MLTKQQLDEVSLATKGGLVDSLGQRARNKMHKKFVSIINPKESETILDVGASANPAFVTSNYLESEFPHLNITALGLGETNPVWEKLYPNVKYIHGSALDLPLEDKSYDIVYSHAVIEHVGSYANQIKMISEAMRVARRDVWITTPYRWHPVEFHTLLPLLHWLPKSMHRSLLDKLGRSYFATEEALNLLDISSLKKAVRAAGVHQYFDMKVHISTFLGLPANLLLHIKRK